MMAPGFGLPGFSRPAASRGRMVEKMLAGQRTSQDGRRLGERWANPQGLCNAMRLVCPSCGTVYEVPDSLVLPGRMVGCHHCHHQWVPLPLALAQAAKPQPRPAVEPPLSPLPAPDAELPPLTATEPIVTRLLPSRPVKEERGAGTAVWLLWGLSLLLLAALAWGTIAYRQQIALFWPPSERLYLALGYRLSPPLPGSEKSGSAANAAKP